MVRALRGYWLEPRAALAASNEAEDGDVVYSRRVNNNLFNEMTIIPGNEIKEKTVQRIYYYYFVHPTLLSNISVKPFEHGGWRGRRLENRESDK